MKDFTEKRKDRIVYVAVAIMVLILLGARVLWAATVQTPIRMHFGETQDSIRVQVRAFNTVVGTFVKASTGLVDTIIPMGEDTLWQVYLRAYKAPDSVRSWTYQLNRRYSQGPIEWPIEMYWAELTDSVRCKFYKDSVLSTSFKISGVQSFDSSFTCNRGSGSGADTVYNLAADFYYAGQTIPASWLWNLEWRRIDTGQIIAQPVATKARFFAFFQNLLGEAARGVLVTVKRSAAFNSTTNTNPSVGITADVISPRCDSLGKWVCDVIATNQFSDTANGYYDIKAVYKSTTLLNLVHVYAPAGQTVNIMDSLSVRH